MNLRFDIVMLLMVEMVILILGMFLLDDAFKSSYNEKHHRHDIQFQPIQTELDKKNYSEVIISNQILSYGELGVNDIRAKSYKALAKLKLGDLSSARTQLQTLIETYNIVTNYVDIKTDGVNTELTISSILASMDLRDWIMLVFILGGSVVVYERVRRSTLDNNQTMLINKWR